MNLAELRENYTQGGLEISDVSPSPFQQFQDWIQQAQDAQIIEPNAMTLSTANASGEVSARTVLLKGIEDETFQFFTNYQSRKANDLSENPHASLTFLWKELERQVCIRGTVSQTSREISEAYFHSRPYESQIGAWTSAKQSGKLLSRASLEERDAELRKKYAKEQEVPLPDFWGGYALAPHSIEFWQGRPSRLHDRICYQGEGSQWSLTRLSP